MYGICSDCVQKVLLFEEDIFNLQSKVSVSQECALERDLFENKLSDQLGCHVVLQRFC